MPLVVKFGSHTPIGNTSRISDAKRVTLVIPTKNKKKSALIEKTVRKFIKEARLNFIEEVELIVIQVPVKSDGGEQPYDKAGFHGVFSRIYNAYLNIPQRNDLMGLVIIGAIENYIQGEPSGEAYDHGIIAFYNANTNRSSCVYSDGAPVPRILLEEAATGGFEDEAQTKGTVTVGSLTAKSFPEIDPADWHKEVCRESRYELL